MFSQPKSAADTGSASTGLDRPTALPPAQVADTGRIRMGGGCRFRPVLRPKDDSRVVSLERFSQT